MDHDECRQLIEHQIGRWVSRPIMSFFDKIVLRRLDLDGLPTETLYTIRLHDPVDYEVAILDNAAQLVAESHVFGFVESAQRDANARKGSTIAPRTGCPSCRCSLRWSPGGCSR